MPEPVRIRMPHTLKGLPLHESERQEQVAAALARIIEKNRKAALRAKLERAS